MTVQTNVQVMLYKRQESAWIRVRGAVPTSEAAFDSPTYAFIMRLAKLEGNQAHSTSDEPTVMSSFIFHLSSPPSLVSVLASSFKALFRQRRQWGCSTSVSSILGSMRPWDWPGLIQILETWLTALPGQ